MLKSTTLLTGSSALTTTIKWTLTVMIFLSHSQFFFEDRVFFSFSRCECINIRLKKAYSSFPYYSRNENSQRWVNTCNQILCQSLPPSFLFPLFKNQNRKAKEGNGVWGAYFGLSSISETQFYQVPKVVQIQGLTHTKQIQSASVFSPVNRDNSAFLIDS